MKGHPWQIRMREAGLTARDVCAFTGKNPSTLSRQFNEDRIEPYVKAIVVAWELMSSEQREAFRGKMATIVLTQED